MTPTKLGRYEVLGELGKGAMGVVYLARDPIIERRVALKTFRLGYSAQDQELEQFRTRFLREAQSAGILNHPNIVTIHDVVEDTDAGVIFIAMEYVQGTDLKQLMQRRDRLPLRFVIEAVAQIADGLHYAHGKGVVHRDVKPANIIITADKQVKITDFGIARLNQSNLTVEGQMLGTPNYMAPEQVLAREVDHRADIFSLGVLLYELTTGAKPFQGDNLTVVTHRIVHEPFQPPEERVAGLPGALAAVLDRAMRKNPAERYESAEAVATDLRAILAPKVAPGTPRTTSFLEPATSDPATPPTTASSSDGSVTSWSQAGDGTAATVVTPRSPGGPHAPTAPSHVGSSAGAPPVATMAGPRPPAQPAMLPPDPETGVLPAQTVPPPPTAPRPSRRPSIGRLATVSALAATLAIVVAAGIWFATARGRTIAPAATSPEAELQRRWLPLYTEGLGLLDSGDPVAAIERFDRALAIAPANRKLRQAREQADRVLAMLAEGERPEDAAARRVTAAQRALDRRRYQEAYDLAGEVLELDGRNADAREIRQQAQEGLARQAQTRDRFRTPIARGGGSAPPTTSAPAPAPSATGTLTIDFRSAVSTGMLTIYIGQESIFREAFDFVERGLIRREARGGQLNATRTVPAGSLKLKIYLWRKGVATEVAQLEGSLPAGGSRTLRVRADAEGNLDAQLE